MPIRSRRLRIGSSVDADVIVEDPTVSRIHCEFEIGPDGLTLRDLGSTNGTYVGGAAVKEVVVAPGALITLGSCRITIEDEAAVEVPTLAAFGSAIAASASMQQVFALLARLAPSEVTITLIGETGTGKDVLARAVHEASARSSGPFAVFDCGSVTSTLIESELFGHERGAFTGAVAERAGAFERAAGGTLFLDEVGEMPLELQPRLLRALEQREVRRVGGGTEIPVDVRVIAATNRDLATEVGAGRFRQDLYFRLSAAVVQVPPLRDRKDDLAHLVERLLGEVGRPVRVTPAALAALASYDWPGNVRELRNVLTTAAAMIDGDLLDVRHLMFPTTSVKREPSLDELPLAGQSLEALERAAIRQTLEHESGNRTRTAKVLGIAPSTLYEKIKKYGL
ncbi:MAG: sigma 54-interacting transcriptional regulator [Deltaproteobacteria bacterium]|nr:sigma 54-interacting transcriptional regulator [Deltaproteobacteria bacterium]